jgi:hypothetical protein
MAVPVYLFLGFLESGKTTFLQKTLEDKRFQDGERTLLVMCEEGIEEIEPDKISGNITIFDGTDKASCNPKALLSAYKAAKAERVIFEFNGMWMINDLVEMLPRGWQIYQVMLMMDSTTFPMYYSNMKQLVNDKLAVCEMVAFNRCDENTDREMLHKAVRAVNRRADILFEDKEGRVDYDDLPDELPYDLEADVVEIEDLDFGIFYLDAMDSPNKYDGKKIKVMVQAAKTPKLPKDTFIGGRFCMTCCADDVQFIGFIFKTDKLAQIENKGFYEIEATVRAVEHPAYEGVGPVFEVNTVKKCGKPKDDFVYFR